MAPASAARSAWGKKPDYKPKNHPDFGVKSVSVPAPKVWLLSGVDLAPPPSSRPLIVLIDDEPLDLEMMDLIFRQADATCSLRRLLDAREALASLTRGNGAELLPRLIFTDLNMPAMNGLEVVRAVRADPRLEAVPVILLSALARPRDVDQARALGANGFLLKFPRPEVLADLVVRAGEGRLAGAFFTAAGT